jgi:hypothetical protein
MNVQSLSVALALCLAAGAAAQPLAPIYSATFTDCTTNQNAFTFGGLTRWSVTPGCDRYQNDVYERPTSSGFELAGGRFGALEYWENLDIASARIGADNRFLYVSITLVGLNRIDASGPQLERLTHKYGFRISTNADGRFGYLFFVDDPAFASSAPNVYFQQKTFGYLDTDGDVGGAASSGPSGRNVTKTDNPLEEQGLNGYDSAIISDGQLSNSVPALWARIDPASPTTVELALDYLVLGLTPAQARALLFTEFDAGKGSMDPQNFQFNDRHSAEEAGSPNLGPTGASEFGTNGTANVSELDTLSGSAIGNPAPCAADFNADGTLNPDDLADFIACYFNPSAGCAPTDVDLNGTINPDDLSDYITLFFAGCP